MIPSPFAVDCWALSSCSISKTHHLLYFHCCLVSRTATAFSYASLSPVSFVPLRVTPSVKSIIVGKNAF
ncbi:hypothetical protein EUTSA_v10009277mg [Eutrema salsugineum]|uniref:Uncharacterized protein n=1 Tax=Eutrema salsugineum TaxID=72664 RepID=V4KFB3_EUTSA|nr:hypothetical protein EUTSA_v10009277mg [Eutrema salsugineum]